jgi:uncharacterized membrane protein (DUF106 family)
VSSIVLEVIVIAILYVIVSVTVQRKVGNFERMREIRKQLNEKMKDLRKLGNTASSAELKAKQDEITALTSESLKHQMKPTLLVLPISLVLFYVALPLVFGSQKVDVSLLGITLTSYQYLFVVSAFVCGLAATGILSMYDRMAASKKDKIAKEVEQAAAQENKY